MVLRDAGSAVEQRLIGPPRRMIVRQRRVTGLLEKLRERSGVAWRRALEHLHATDRRAAAREAREQATPAVETTLVLRGRQKADRAGPDRHHRGVRAEPPILEDPKLVPVGDGHAEDLA